MIEVLNSSNWTKNKQQAINVFSAFTLKITCCWCTNRKRCTEFGISRCCNRGECVCVAFFLLFLLVVVELCNRLFSFFFFRSVFSSFIHSFWYQAFAYSYLFNQQLSVERVCLYSLRCMQHCQISVCETLARYMDCRTEWSPDADAASMHECAIYGPHTNELGVRDHVLFLSLFLTKSSQIICDRVAFSVASFGWACVFGCVSMRKTEIRL